MSKFFIIVLFLFSSVFSNDLLDKKKSFDEIEKAKKQTIEDINKNKDLQKTLKIEIDDNEREIKKLEKEIADFSERVFFLKNNIISVEENIVQIEKNLSSMKEKLKKRIVAIYKNKGNSYLSLFFNTDNFQQFTTKFKMLKRIIVKDNELFEHIKQDLIKLHEKKEELSSKRSTFKNMEGNLLEKQKQFEQMKENSKKLLAIKEQEQTMLENQYKEYLESSKKIADMISSLEDKRLEEIKKQKEHEALEKQENTKIDTPVFSNKDLKENDEQQRKKIDFVWPVDGDVTIISHFGKQKNKVNTMFDNKGIDIKVAENSNVKATADGIVMYKGQMNGYGKIIIIDHGYGLTTLYAHLKDITVGIRQKVVKGEYIAKVGPIVNEEECSLHFEVRVYGSPENPLNLF